ncbi:MAG: GvpL/GvpF family gas vesicle protein [Nanoarchaeota archaeon]|nr:GvpL/GvpF family gas vesicle protein [Nanoarchaeota archaeon]
MVEEQKTKSCVEAKEEGRYVYCVADSDQVINLGKIGIEDNEVYTVSGKGLCAVVHNCEAEPYVSDDDKKVKDWIKTHQKVVETSEKKLGAVIPLTFDTIVKGADPNSLIIKWLEEENENLKKLIEKIKGKQEFGVQICWDEKIIGQKLAEENEEIKRLKEKIKGQGRGTAYFYEQRIKDALKKEMGKSADAYFKKFYEQIKNQVDNIRVAKIKKMEEGKEMLAHFSCLVYKDKTEQLQKELTEINDLEGFSVILTGPWPPYSFVSLENMSRN